MEYLLAYSLLPASAIHHHQHLTLRQVWDSKGIYFYYRQNSINLRRLTGFKLNPPTKLFGSFNQVASSAAPLAVVLGKPVSNFPPHFPQHNWENE